MAAVQAFREAIAAVSPFRCVEQAVSLRPDVLQVFSSSFPLKSSSKVVVLAFGKASLAMAAAAETSLGSRFYKGVVLAPVGSPSPFQLKSKILYGARGNLPDEASVAGTAELLSLAEASDFSDNIILFLISGGGSALFCSPEGVSLEEKLTVIRILVSHGATIQQLNTVRQRLSRVKGGKALERIRHAQVVSLIMSDVVGDPLHLIASGPTVPPVSDSDPLETLRSLGISLDSLSPSVAVQLSRKQESPPLPSTAQFLVATNSLALSALKDFLQEQGYSAHIVSSSLCGDASERGRQFARLIVAGQSDLAEAVRQIVPEYQWVFQNRNQTEFRLEGYSPKLALIFGGEMTVKGVGKGSGIGGRNQHLVLECLRTLTGKPRSSHKFSFLSGGTDGQDGPTTAAGAVITNEDVISAANSGKIKEYLDNFDSFNFWNSFKSGACHIHTGATGTNVMDIQLCLLDAS